MTATPLRRSFRFCAGILAASITLQEAAGAQTSRNVPSNYSCYNTEAVAINDWNAIDINAFAQATKKVGGQSLRVPGGDTANYWHWEDYTVLDANGNPALDSNGNVRTADYGPSGSVVSSGGFNSAGFFEYSRPTNAFPFFLPQTLPASLQFQPTTNNATLENIEKLTTGAGAEPIWVMNMNTSFLEKELDHLKKAQSLGMQVNRIELGNELYFRGGFDDLPGLEQNYVRANQPDSATPQVGGHPTPLSYAEDAKLWADTIRTVFPDAKIAVTGIAGVSSPNDPRINNWMADIQAPLGADGRSAIDAVDAFTIHPYYDAVNDLGVQLSDATQAQPQRAGDIARAGISKLRSILAEPQINSPALQNKEVWVTEHNIIESDPVVIGNTWFGALMVDAHGHEFLKDQRTQLSCAHVLTGNAQWQAIADETGTVIDPAKRGVDGQPFSDIAQPFSQTATGLVLGKSADVFTEGTATLLQSGDASVAWRVENDDGDKISAVNAGDVDEALKLPAGEIWEVLTFTGDPWATITEEEELDILLEIVTGGSTISIPAFSKLIATADPNAETPQAPAAAGEEGVEAIEIAEATEDAVEATEDVVIDEGTIIAAAPGPVVESAALTDAPAAAESRTEGLAKSPAEGLAEGSIEGDGTSGTSETEAAPTESPDDNDAEKAQRLADAKAERVAEARAERVAAARAERVAERVAAARAERVAAARAERMAGASNESSASLIVEADAVSLAADANPEEASAAEISMEEANLLQMLDVSTAVALETNALLDTVDTTDFANAIDVALVEALGKISGADEPGDALTMVSASALTGTVDTVLAEAMETVLAEAPAVLAEADGALVEGLRAEGLQAGEVALVEGTLIAAEVSADLIAPLDTALVSTFGGTWEDIPPEAIAHTPAAAVIYEDARESKSVPEPAAVLGLGLMAASLAVSRRRKPSDPKFSKVA